MTEVKYVKPYVFYVAHRRTFLQRFWHSRFVNRLRWMSHGHSDCYSTRVPRWVRADISQASMTFAVKRELPTATIWRGPGSRVGTGLMDCMGLTTWSAAPDSGNRSGGRENLPSGIRQKSPAGTSAMSTI